MTTKIIRCIVIDDDALARMIIGKLCEENPNLVLVQEFENAISAIKYLNTDPADLIFLDIHMPDFDGMDFVQTIKSPPQIILTTSDPSFAIQAFEYDFIVDYLVKPISSERFQKAIDRAKKGKQSYQASDAELESEQANSEKQLFVNIYNRLIKIDIGSIYLVEAKGDYIYIKTEEKEYKVHSTLKKIEGKLPSDLFLKVHRSFVINLKQIVDIEDNSVLIKREIVPVSRGNRPELMKRLNLL